MHADKTLRKSKRTAPRMRKIPAPEPEEQQPATGKQAALLLSKEDATRRTATPLPADTTTPRTTLHEGATEAAQPTAGGTDEQQQPA